MNLKKLLSAVSIISATITGSLNIVACNNNTKSDIKSIEEKKSLNKNEDNNKNDNQNTKKNTNLNSPKQTNQNLKNETINQEENQTEKNNYIIWKNNIKKLENYKKINPFYENKTFSANEINAINMIKKTKFSITIPKGQEVKNLYNQINGNFISYQLSYDLKKALNLSAFKVKEITIKKNNWEHILTTQDLNIENILEAIIEFNYKNEIYKVPLTINILAIKEISDNDILEITKNFIILKNKDTITTNTDDKINILSPTAVTKYISHLTSYIDFHNEAKELNINSLTNTKDIKKLIKHGMRHYFAKNDKSLIKNIFNPKKLKINTIYIKKNENEKVLLTNTQLNANWNEPIIKLVVSFTYDNTKKISDEIILNLVSTTLYDEQTNQTITLLDIN